MTVGLAACAVAARPGCQAHAARTTWRCAIALVGALALGGCATNPVTGKQDLVLMSEQQELALGLEAHRETLEEYRLYADQALASYVDGIGQRLAAVSHRRDLRYTFSVLDTPEINAFALPGGYIYVTRGLVAYMNSEAELAAVLGHEIGHVTARHGVRQASSAQATNVGVGLLGVLFPQLAGARQSLGLLGTALLRGYGREHELEADRLGAEYLAASGYDPRAMLDVIRTLKEHELFDRELARLEGREARAYHGLFSTHPDNDTRLREIVTHAAAMAQGGARDRDRFLDAIEGLVFGTDPADGVVVGQRFLHGGLGMAFEFPAGWLVQNEADQVLVVGPGREAVVSLRVLRIAPGTAPAAVMQRTGIGELQQAQAFDGKGYAGLTGLAAVGSGAARVPARLSVLCADEHAWIFTGLVREAPMLARHDATFLAMARSLRRLDPAERKRLTAHRLTTVALTGRVDWAALAKASPLTRLAEAQLRLLNAAGSDAAPAPGSRIKLIR